MKKEKFSLNLLPEQYQDLQEIKRQTNVAMSEVLRRLFRFLPQVRQELIEEARKRLNEAN